MLQGHGCGGVTSSRLGLLDVFGDFVNVCQDSCSETTRGNVFVKADVLFDADEHSLYLLITQRGFSTDEKSVRRAFWDHRSNGRNQGNYTLARFRFCGFDERTVTVRVDNSPLNMDMNTLISEGQGGISGGQKQRLMIARAVAPKPKVLVFDEATSALDNITQKKVSEALDRMNCTRIVIAHRLSTVRNCDRILVMDQGRIIEEGSYDQLIRKKGYFAELVDRQRLDH